jgi:hypothetical protein
VPTRDTTQQVTAVLPRDLVARLDAYAAERRWSRSVAIAALVEDGLARAGQEDGGRRTRQRNTGKQ